jgi:hypothetical protein
VKRGDEGTQSLTFLPSNNSSEGEAASLSLSLSLSTLTTCC